MQNLVNSYKVMRNLTELCDILWTSTSLLTFVFTFVSTCVFTFFVHGCVHASEHICVHVFVSLLFWFIFVFTFVVLRPKSWMLDWSLCQSSLRRRWLVKSLELVLELPPRRQARWPLLELVSKLSSRGTYACTHSHHPLKWIIGRPIEGPPSWRGIAKMWVFINGCFMAGPPSNLQCWFV